MKILPRVFFSTTCLSKCFICVVVALTSVPIRAADNVGEILKQIKAEKSGAIKPDKPSTSASSTQTSTRNKPKPQKTPESSKPQSANTARSQPKSTPFAMPIHGPKDKLPKQIAGHGLAGDFLITGHFEGCVRLEAAADRGNIFCRTFIVSNASIDLPEYHMLPLDQWRPLKISRSKPLIFERKGSLAYYYVRIQ